METRDLKIFQAVAREGSVTKAAELLNYVQSNVTNRIQYLEAQLKTPLFRRSNRGMTLTPAGENLMKYAEEILTLMDEAIKSSQCSEYPSGPLRIGAMETTAASYLTPIFKDYHARYPDVELALITGETHDLLKKVLKYELDGAFIYGPVEEPGLESIPAFEDELVLISEAGQSDVGPLLTKPMLFFDVGCTHRSKADCFLRENGFASYQVMEFGTLEVILSGVSSGLGVSLLPYSSIRNAEITGRVVSHRLPEKYRKLEIYFVHKKDLICSSALLKMLQFIKLRYCNIG